MRRPVEGDLVAWWDGPALAVAIVASAEGPRLRLVRGDGSETRATAARVALVLSEDARVGGTGSAAARAANAESRIRERAVRVDVALLWELSQEAGGAPLALGDLAELALGERTGEACAAIVMAFAHDGLRFVRRGDVWEPRAPEAVEALVHEREVAARRARELDEARAALRAAARGESSLPEAPGDALRRYVAALETVALEDLDADPAVRDVAIEALAAAQMHYETPAEGAFRLLRAFGRFASDDENLAVLRYRLRDEFPEAVLRAADEAAARGPLGAARDDLTAIPTIAIDSASTAEVDDALAIEPLGGRGWRLTVAIADPAAFVEPGDPVDAEAEARGLTYYFPDRRLNMLPGILSEHAATLEAGSDRPALAFVAEVRPDGSHALVRVSAATVRVCARMTYDHADEMLVEGHGEHAQALRALDEAAAALESARLAAGGVLILAPEVDLKVRGGGMILERTEARSKSRRLVTEAMILAGAMAARWCVEHGIPALFRRQPPPDRGFEIAGRIVEDPVDVRELRRSLRRGESSVVPGTHFALGLDAYAQVTSPIRRYQDLVVHRQIRAAIADRPLPYDEDALRRILASTDRAEAEARRAERQVASYWLLRYLESCSGSQVVGTVVETRPRPTVLLDETLQEFPVPALEGAERGERVTLRVERVVPRAGIVRLRPL